MYNRMSSLSPKGPSDSMEVCSPSSPKLENNRATLPAFLLGPGVETPKQKRHVSFNTTPVKSRDDENTNPNYNYNRFSKQLSNDLKSRTSNPFNRESRKEEISERPSIPVGGLGSHFGRISTQENVDHIAQTSKSVHARKVSDINVMASSPLPDKQMVSRIATPDMSSGSPIEKLVNR